MCLSLQAIHTPKICGGSCRKACAFSTFHIYTGKCVSALKRCVCGSASKDYRYKGYTLDFCFTLLIQCKPQCYNLHLRLAGRNTGDGNVRNCFGLNKFFFSNLTNLNYGSRHLNVLKLPSLKKYSSKLQTDQIIFSQYFSPCILMKTTLQSSVLCIVWNYN